MIDDLFDMIMLVMKAAFVTWVVLMVFAWVISVISGD